MEGQQKYEPYRIIAHGGTAEIEEKKSRFIAHVEAVSSEEEALAFVGKIKKQYWDARHNCYAYIVGEQGELKRFSDDGEPSGTAGRPILEVLENAGLRDLALVVTRYFGGTLLGMGGLVRAYTKAAQEGLAASGVCTMACGYELTVVSDYNGIGKIQYLLGRRGIAGDEVSYGEQVRLRVHVPMADRDAVLREIADATAGRAAVTADGPVYYAAPEKPHIDTEMRREGQR